VSKRRVASGGSGIFDRPETAVDLMAALALPYQMAYDALLTSDVLNVFIRVVALFSTQQCRPIDNCGDGVGARFA
jgi:hypothetical protein